MVEKKAIDIEELAALIEDSLSACMGGNVTCPTIHLKPDPFARENWHIELDDVDILVIQAIKPLQQRFNVKPPRSFSPGFRSLPVRFTAASNRKTERERDGMSVAASHRMRTTKKSNPDNDTKKLFDESRRAAQQAQDTVRRWSEANRSFWDTHKVTLRELGKLRMLVEQFPSRS
jgi:hypothetical protein